MTTSCPRLPGGSQPSPRTVLSINWALRLQLGNCAIKLFSGKDWGLVLLPALSVLSRQRHNLCKCLDMTPLRTAYLFITVLQVS